MRTTPDDDFGQLVNQTAKSVRQRMARASAALGLTAPQAAVLLTLSEGAMPVSLAAERLGMDRPTMTGLAERLVGHGWAVLTPNPDDGRSKLIGLTPAAQRALPALQHTARGLNAQALRSLDPAEQSLLLALLRRVAADLDETTAKKETP